MADIVDVVLYGWMIVFILGLMTLGCCLIADRLITHDEKYWFGGSPSDYNNSERSKRKKNEHTAFSLLGGIICLYGSFAAIYVLKKSYDQDY